jgi:hypothetical protein
MDGDAGGYAGDEGDDADVTAPGEGEDEGEGGGGQDQGARNLRMSNIYQHMHTCFKLLISQVNYK